MRAGVYVTEQLAWFGASGGGGLGLSMQLDGGINCMLPGAALNEPPIAEAMKSTVPVGEPPPPILLTMAVHTVWSIIMVPGPKTVGLQLTAVLVEGCA